MRGRLVAGVLAALCAVSSPAGARTAVDFDAVFGGAGQELPPYLQCVPYARQVSGIRIFGDAHTWWDQAEGRYARGSRPQVGAVMAFRPHSNMRLGHVAAVSKVIDARTLLIRHANWSPIDGRRGQIEDDVRAVDVSPGNDWSEVRIWFAPIQALGGTHWPIDGFIYGNKPGAPAPKVQVAKAQPARVRDPIGEIIAGSRPAARPRQAKASDPIGAIIARQNRSS